MSRIGLIWLPIFGFAAFAGLGYSLLFSAHTYVGIVFGPLCKRETTARRVVV